MPAPDLAALRRTSQVMARFGDLDGSWHALLAATAPGPDLGGAGHRELLLRWLNSWGCRIRYPREHEPPVYHDGVGQWWLRWGARLPRRSLATLTDGDVAVLAEAFDDLSAVAVAPAPHARSIGPTAASKALYALRPHAVMPWDAMIASALHGARDGAAFAAHQRLGRQWAGAVLAEAQIGKAQIGKAQIGKAQIGEADVPALVGRDGVSLAKVLDEYCYVLLTLGLRDGG